MHFQHKLFKIHWKKLAKNTVWRRRKNFWKIHLQRIYFQKIHLQKVYFQTIMFWKIHFLKYTLKRYTYIHTKTYFRQYTFTHIFTQCILHTLFLSLWLFEVFKEARGGKGVPVHGTPHTTVHRGSFSSSASSYCVINFPIL